MAAAKPAAGTAVDTSNPLAPNYGAWLLTFTNPEVDSCHVGTVSGPRVGGVTAGLNPNGEPCSDFNGTTGGIYSLSGLSTPNQTPPIAHTIIARIKPRSVSGFRNIYAHNSQGFFLDAGKPRLYSQVAANTALTVNTWYTVGVTVDISNNTKYYINGVLDRTVASGTIGIPAPGGGSIGIGKDSAGEFFDGLIDYVFLWVGSALSDADHLTIHNDPFSVLVAPNTAPIADAGPDQSITLPTGAALEGSATDDGLPTGTLTYTWSKISGPGTVTFADATDPTTTVAFSEAGAYVLRLTVSDGALSDTDDVTITVADPPAPTIRRMRRAPHIANENKINFFDNFELHLETGLGLSSGQGSDPQVMLRWSDDGGQTWSNEHWVSAGAIGNYKARAKWWKLGAARDRVFEVTVTDPIAWRLVDAYLQVRSGSR